MGVNDKNTLYRQIVETAGDAVIFADRDGIIRLWNRAAEGMFGYTEAETVGQSLRQRLAFLEAGQTTL